jgi:FkbH-like protein
MSHLEWLPLLSEPSGAIKAAASLPSCVERLAALAAIAGHQLGFLDLIQLNRAIVEAGSQTSAGLTRVKIALIGSNTLDHLVAPLRAAGLRYRLFADMLVGGYGQYRQDVLSPHSSLHEFAPQFVVFSITAKDVLGPLPIGASPADAEALVRNAVDALRTLWRTVRDRHSATILQQTFLDVEPPLFGNFDRQVPASPTSLVARLNDTLAAAALEEGALLVDVARRSQLDGLDSWYDVTRWLQAKQEIAPRVAPLFGELVARTIAARLGMARKCLVLDLDNTLWGGVIGEDGLEGIVLGQGSASGEAHLQLQHYARALRERGVLLAVCSKNEAAIAENAFLHHPEMVLRRSDFASFVANWSDKADNVRQIAKELNIGLDSLVFVDDNPAERARMRQALPMVAVPEMPQDPAHYVRVLAEAGYFEAASLTAEDLGRAGQYAANAEREGLREQYDDLEDFLRNLEMSAISGAFEPGDLPRIAQLINKTNQFNTTTKRYSLQEVRALMSARENITLQFRLLDRLGDNGLVSTMIILPVGNGVFEIDNWVMSCRVFGRDLEYEAMNTAVDAVRERGGWQLTATYVPTAKNAVIKDLFSRLGFEPDVMAEAGGTTRWQLAIDSYQRRRTQIHRKDAA